MFLGVLLAALLSQGFVKCAQPGILFISFVTAMSKVISWGTCEESTWIITSILPSSIFRLVLKSHIADAATASRTYRATPSLPPLIVIDFDSTKAKRPTLANPEGKDPGQEHPKRADCDGRKACRSSDRIESHDRVGRPLAL
mmetsp:Transcript_36624/g.74713  ORF Transcript_36624/g.74713 Transcript_36624/m.74713 type:complete len:142 (+) Transcript_36624:587-1012(+)